MRTALPAPRGVVRRWAATHLLRRGCTDVDSLVARCEGLSAYDADAVIAGIVEAIDHLPEHESARAIAFGLAAGNSNTRLLTLQALLVEKGPTLRSAALNKIRLPGSAPGQPRSPGASNRP